MAGINKKVVRVFDGYTQANLEKFGGFDSYGFLLEKGEIKAICESNIKSLNIVNMVGGGEVINVDDYVLDDDKKVFVAMVEHDVKKGFIDVTLSYSGDFNKEEKEFIKDHYRGKISKRIEFKEGELQTFHSKEEYIKYLQKEKVYFEDDVVEELFA